MRRKIKSCAFLLALTLAFSGCVAVKVEEGQIPVKPEVTEAPEKQETPEVTEAPETPETTEQPEVTAEPEGSEVVEQPEATEVPEATLEPLPSDSVEFPDDTVVPLAMGSTVGVDLNGDGTQELIQVAFGILSDGSTTAGNALYHAVPTIRINDYIFDETYLQEKNSYYPENADIATWYIFDVDVNDGYKEIGLYEDGPSDDAYTTLFRYEGSELRKIGGFSDCPIDGSVAGWGLQEGDDYQELVNSVKRGDIRIQVPGDGMIFATQRVDILETSFAEGMWKLQNSESFEEARLELQVREEYTFKGYEYRMTDTEVCPMVREELQIFSDKDFTSQIMVLAQGEKVIPYRYYPDKEEGERNGWVELKYGEDFKTSGWIYATNQMNISQINEDGGIKDIWSGDLLDNLSFAD